jgi:hypothetical protein
MSTLSSELHDYNESLDNCLRSRHGMSLRTFKTLKAVVQLVGAAAGVYAMQLGAPPLAALALITLMVTGPEGMEYIINQEA